MKKILLVVVAFTAALIYLVSGTGNALPEAKTTTTPTIIAKPKMSKDTTTLITGNVTYSIGDKGVTSFRDDPRWKKATNQN